MEELIEYRIRKDLVFFKSDFFYLTIGVDFESDERVEESNLLFDFHHNRVLARRFQNVEHISSFLNRVLQESYKPEVFLENISKGVAHRRGVTKVAPQLLVVLEHLDSFEWLSSNGLLLALDVVDHVANDLIHGLHHLYDEAKSEGGQFFDEPYFLLVVEIKGGVENRQGELTFQGQVDQAEQRRLDHLLRDDRLAVVVEVQSCVNFRLVLLLRLANVTNGLGFERF